MFVAIPSKKLLKSHKVFVEIPYNIIVEIR